MIQFLTDIYSEDNSSMRGLRISSDPHQANVHNQHEVAIDWVMRKKKNVLGMTNYGQRYIRFLSRFAWFWVAYLLALLQNKWIWCIIEHEFNKFVPMYKVSK